ncbi:MAG: GGDEF domain-containing protein, partial [Fibrobacterota bacterium]
LGLVDRDKRKIRIEAVQSLPDKHLGQMVAIGEGVIGLVAQSRNPLILHGHGVGDGRLPQYPFDQWNGIMAVPLEAAGKLVGVLSLVEKSPLREFSQSDLELLTMFAQQAAMAIRTVQLLERARHQAETDSLTGLYNHRHFFEMSKKEVNRSIQENRSLSAIMFDIDFFKQVNDTYGHSVGDQVITSISNLCRQVFRKADIVGRYGGEEFSVILPDTDIVKAREVAERIRKGIEEIRFTSSQGTFSVSISVGLACLNRRCCSLNDLICRADEALYEAKDNGRNRICVWRHGLANSYRTAEQNAVLEVKPDQDNPSTAVRTE